MVLHQAFRARSVFLLQTPIWPQRESWLRRVYILLSWVYIHIYVDREREMYEKQASAVRCDTVLHRAVRARHLSHEM